LEEIIEIELFVRTYKYKDIIIYKGHTDEFVIICRTKLSKKLEGSTKRQVADRSVASTRRKCTMEIAVNIVVCKDTIVAQMTFNN